jgi:hypothetical protein
MVSNLPSISGDPLILFRLEFGLVLLSLGPLAGDLYLLNRVSFQTRGPDSLIIFV